MGQVRSPASYITVSELIDSFDVCHHHFADDLHLLVAMEAGDHTSALERLIRCSDAVRRWFLRNYLQLNADKSDVMMLGTATQLRSVAAVTTVDVAGSPPVKARDEVAWRHHRQHAAAVAKACIYHIHALRHARHSANRRNGPYRRLQHRRVEIGLLQHCIVWCPDDDD